jgi:uncharacterized OB-fold protein
MRHTFYRLEGSVCGACDRRLFPPRTICPECRRGDLATVAFSGRGTLYSFTRVTLPPRGFASVGPYDVGMVRLEEGPLVTAQLTDTDGTDLSIGMPVEMVTRKVKDAEEHTQIVYGYKFRPLLRRSRSRPRS